MKATNEFRDPVHGFVHVDASERAVVDSPEVQRLRHVHQLALTYLVYSGATHKRFEHSLGVMELAGRVFDVITSSGNRHPQVAAVIPELQRENEFGYWRRVVRMAALCHDLGHLPFSHAAEHELLPHGWDHERLTVEIIMSDSMRELWNDMTPPLRPDDVARVAVGKKKLPEWDFTEWQSILSEIIVGDAFGVDRIDYLLRDSLHAGVGYGRFDHYRLLETLRLLPAPGSEDGSVHPELGVELGGLHSAEALLLARYFMFTQVYFHRVRRIYDLHLMDFLRSWLPGGQFQTQVSAHLEMTDTEVLAAMAAAARTSEMPGHDAAKRIVERDHYKVIWQANPADLSMNPEAGNAIFEAAIAKYSSDHVKRDHASQSAAVIDFPVKAFDGSTTSAQLLSDVLRNIPPAAFDFVYVEPSLRDDAEKWLAAEKNDIIKPITKE